jgi:type IV secretory pathway VirB3-like protein
MRHASGAREKDGESKLLILFVGDLYLWKHCPLYALLKVEFLLARSAFCLNIRSFKDANLILLSTTVKYANFFSSALQYDRGF